MVFAFWYLDFQLQILDAPEDQQFLTLNRYLSLNQTHVHTKYVPSKVLQLLLRNVIRELLAQFLFSQKVERTTAASKLPAHRIP